MFENFHLISCLTLAIIAARAAAETYCDNNCKPTASTNGKYYCVPSNTNKYTVCSNGIRHEFNCAAGLVWDSAVNVCNWPAAAAPCSCNGVTSATTTTKKATTTTTKLTTTLLTTPPTTKPVSSASTSSSSGVTTTTTQSSPSGSMNIICYYTNWAQYRTGSASFKPENIDASLCTHIIYAFLNFDTSSISYREWNDDVMVPKVIALKSANPNLKVIASIGGWNAGTDMFHQIIATAASRSKFNSAAISFLRQYKFDGLDVDFEYPGDVSRGSPAGDKALFTTWMQSLQSDFANEAATSGKPRLILAAAIGSGKPTVDNSYDIPALSQSLDFISVMTYDFHGTWETVTGYNAPLYKMSSWPSGSSLEQFTTSYAINYLLSKGAPASKLMMGIPLYGHTFRLANAANNGIGAPTIGAGDQGKYTGEAGFNSYYETCMLSKCTTKPYTYIYNTELQGPYMFYGTNWISTEDVSSVKVKAEFAKSKGLGGVMYWAIDLDDFKDMCQNGVKFPLMKTVANTLKGLPPPAVNSDNKSASMC